MLDRWPLAQQRRACVRRSQRLENVTLNNGVAGPVCKRVPIKKAQCPTPRSLCLHGTYKQVLAEYIYIVDPAIGELQSKTVVLDGPVAPGAAGALPLATLHTERGEEVYLTPRSVYPDPLRGGDHVLVLCDAHVPPEVRAAGGAAADGGGAAPHAACETPAGVLA